MAVDRTKSLEEWVPRTRLGKLIQEGKITSIEEVFMEGLPIREPQLLTLCFPTSRRKL